MGYNFFDVLKGRQGLFGNADKGGEGIENPFADFELPEFQEDPDYRATQDYLKELGINILEGDIPDYYKGIGETGGAEFENYLNLIRGDNIETGKEIAAATGRGGGVAQQLANQFANETTTKARYADFLRAMEGKEYLFGQGKNITEGVRASGQGQQAQVNAFELDKSGLDLRARGLEGDFGFRARGEERALADQKFSDIGSLLSLGVNAGAGFLTGGPVGAVAGAMGGVDWAEILSSAAKGKTTTGVKKGTEVNLGQISSKKLNIDQLFADTFRK